MLRHYVIISGPVQLGQVRSMVIPDRDFDIRAKSSYTERSRFWLDDGGGKLEPRVDGRGVFGWLRRRDLRDQFTRTPVLRSWDFWSLGKKSVELASICYIREPAEQEETTNAKEEETGEKKSRLLETSCRRLSVYSVPSCLRVRSNTNKYFYPDRLSRVDLVRWVPSFA